MRKFLLRLIIVLGACLLQFNFLNLIFKEDYSLNFIVPVVVAWVVATKFEKIQLWILLLGAVAGIVSFGSPGFNVIFFFLLAYAVDFISRRFLLEHRLYGFLMVLLLIILIVPVNNIVNLFNFGNFSFSEAISVFAKYLIPNKAFWIRNITGVFLFYFAFGILNRLEKYIAETETKLTGKI